MTDDNNLTYNIEQMASRAPRSLPDVLRRSPASTKLVWLYLRPQGDVSYSRRDVAELLDLPLSSVQIAFNQLDDFGLLEYHGEVRDRAKRNYSVLGAPKRERVAG